MTGVHPKSRQSFCVALPSQALFMIMPHASVVRPRAGNSPCGASPLLPGKMPNINAHQDFWAPACRLDPFESKNPSGGLGGHLHPDQRHQPASLCKPTLSNPGKLAKGGANHPRPLKSVNKKQNKIYRISAHLRYNHQQ